MGTHTIFLRRVVGTQSRFFEVWLNLVERVSASQEMDWEIGGRGKPNRVIGKWGDGESFNFKFQIANFKLKVRLPFGVQGMRNAESGIPKDR
jgi:hypothetical protein